jgi:phosphomannomutase
MTVVFLRFNPLVQKAFSLSYMPLIASISGIRGTIGSPPTPNLNPLEITRFTAAYGSLLQQQGRPLKIIIGRDARPTGEMISMIVCGTLIAMGFEIIDLGLTTTPTVELAVPAEKAAGGIIITASHNPLNWNALKLLNHLGEFISVSEGEAVMEFYTNQQFKFSPATEMGNCKINNSYLDYHIQHILSLSLVNKPAIQKAGLKIVVDAVNSSGGIYVPALLKALGVKDIIEINCVPDGNFSHNPEPLKEHLGEICKRVLLERADLGIVVDPDVDRLVFVTEEGELFGEEYTLVAVADYILSHTPGATVSNLSSTRALRDITLNKQQKYTATSVGEVNVVAEMKQTQAVIGGEGNGGIIYPPSHYGRDALVGIALFLSHLVTSEKKPSDLRNQYPAYFMSKQKIELTPEMDVNFVLEEIQLKYKAQLPNTQDGVKIDFEDSWIHLRKSNTEPIIRIYTEATTQQAADNLAKDMIRMIQHMMDNTH